MRTRMLAAFCAALMLTAVPAVPFVSPSQIYAEGPTIYTWEDYSYTADADGNITICEYNGTDTEVVIPSTIGQYRKYPVTCIGDSVFYNCTSMTSVTIPESVTSIGDGVFLNCKSLTSVNIPESVRSLGDRVFLDCKSLTSVNIPAGVTSIGDSVFEGCTSLTAVNIPAGVTSIGKWAFATCESLTSVELPEGVTSIGRSAFAGCTSLRDVKIPYSVEQIDADAFYSTPWLAAQQEKSQFVIVNGILIDGSNCRGDVTIPDTVRSISGNAFYQWDMPYTTFSIPRSVTYIAEDAFVPLPSFPYSFHVYAYSYAQSYAEKHDIPYTLIEEEQPFEIALNADKTLQIIGYRGTDNSIKVPSAIDGTPVTKIGNYAFSGKSNILYVAIPDSVTAIGAGAFQRCTSLLSMEIPEGVTTIDLCAFLGCTSLEYVVLPKSVTSIGESTFKDCPVLKLRVYPGSYAEAYAKENDIPYVLLADTAPAYGDIDEDGALSIMDVILLNKSLLGGATLSDAAKANADVDKSGGIDTTDALNVLKAVVKLVTLPVKS